mgnify:CR=1 FL=1
MSKSLALVCVDGRPTFPDDVQRRYERILPWMRRFERANEFLFCGYAMLPEFGYRTISTFPMTDAHQYSLWVLHHLGSFIGDSHVLIFQHDGWIVRPDLWDESWLDYDYIGSPWGKECGCYTPGREVGNGGFSVRSRRLMEWCATHTWPWGHNEDTNICIVEREKLDAAGFKFAPVEVARKFSVDSLLDETDFVGSAFGFHGARHVAAAEKLMESRW